MQAPRSLRGAWIIGLLTLFFVTALRAQTVFERTYGGLDRDFGLGVEEVDDGYILVGYTFSYGVGGDVYLVRTDVEGDTIWTRTYGGDSQDRGYSVQSTADGGWVIGGYTWTPWGLYDMYLIKTDSEGEAEFAKTYNYGDPYTYDWGYMVCRASDNGYMLVGKTSSEQTGDDIFLVKADSSGDTLWTKVYAGPGDEGGRALRPVPGDGYIIVGYKGTADTAQREAYILKIDESGGVEWTRVYGQGNYSEAYDVKVDDSGYIVVGYTRLSATDWDVWLLRLNLLGDTLWTRRYGGDLIDIGWSVGQTSDGGYIITGCTQSYGADDLYLVKTDQDGDPLWAKTYGGPGGDCGHSVQQTFDGGYIVAGYTESFGAGGKDVYLLRIDPAGDTLWTKTFGGDSLDIGWSVQETQDSGYVIAGYGWVDNDYGYDFCLIRTDGFGDTLWAKTFGTYRDEYAYSMEQTSDGGYIMGGAEQGHWYDMCLMKIDSSGQKQWSRSYNKGGSPYGEWGFCAQQTSDGGYIIVGSTWGGETHEDVYLVKTDASGDTLWTRVYIDTGYECGKVVRETSDGYIIGGYTNSTGAGYQDVYIIKTDLSGNSQWSRIYGDVSYDAVYDIKELSDGGYIAVGYTGRGGADYDVYLLRLDASGDTLWTRKFGGYSEDYGYSVDPVSNDGYVIAGVTNSYGAGHYDVYLIRTDSLGNTLWTRTFGATSADVGRCVRHTSDRGYIILGDTKSFGMGGEEDIYLIKADSLGNVMAAVEEEQSSVPDAFCLAQNYPNPFKSTTAIGYQVPAVRPLHITLTIYNIAGQKVRTLVDGPHEPCCHTVYWDGRDDQGRDLSSGIYFYQLKTSDGIKEVKKMLLLR